MEKVFGIIITLLVGGTVYWLAPLIVNWLMSHVFVTTYQRTLHRKDLEKRQRTLGSLFTNVLRILAILGVLYYIFVQFLDRSF